MIMLFMFVFHLSFLFSGYDAFGCSAKNAGINSLTSLPVVHLQFLPDRTKAVD